MIQWRPVLGLIACCILAACNLRTSYEETPAPGAQPPAAPTVVQEIIPAASPEPAAPSATTDARSSGSGLSLASGRCFDLDKGMEQESSSAECDFAFSSAGEADSPNLHFSPLSKGSFAFGSVYWEPPTPEACRMITGYGSTSMTITTGQPYYVCYQTGEGYWGWLHFSEYAQSRLEIDWITFNEQSSLVWEAPAPAAAEPVSVPEEKTYAEGTNQWVGYHHGLDLDTSALQPPQETGNDFIVAAGSFDANGAVRSVLLKPVNGAGFLFSDPMDTLPGPADCQALSGYSQEAVAVNITHRFICYQTTRGRLGTLFIHEASPGVGLRIDWATWPEIESSWVEAKKEAPVLSDGYRAELLLPEGMAVVPVYPPGRKFSHTWQIFNAGEIAWSSRFALVFAGGNLMGAVERFSLPYRIEPGKVIKITLNLTAPKAFGTFTGIYWLEDEEGNRFGTGEGSAQPFQVLINVGEPGLTLAEGESAALSPGYCYDLDLGYFAQDDPACDFYLESTLDPALVKFNSPQASFDFEELQAAPPSLGLCQAAGLSSGDRTLDLQDWYVCYKTNQGRYGWLYFRETSGQAMIFDWKTYR